MFSVLFAQFGFQYKAVFADIHFINAKPAQGLTHLTIAAPQCHKPRLKALLALHKNNRRIVDNLNSLVAKDHRRRNFSAGDLRLNKNTRFPLATLIINKYPRSNGLINTTTLLGNINNFAIGSLC
jgi:hypothetical protein